MWQHEEGSFLWILPCGFFEIMAVSDGTEHLWLVRILEEAYSSPEDDIESIDAAKIAALAHVEKRLEEALEVVRKAKEEG
jgi:hypothetical protein